MTMDEGWLPVALSTGVEAGTSNGTRLFGREIVVWRDADGTVHAWEDRCPHRGMRLSLGFVRGDRIACLYHGWQYDTAGQCRYIPAHPQLSPPETIRVRAYDVVEWLGMIWVRNDGSRNGEPPVDRTVTEIRSITIECAPERLAAYLLEARLTPFAETGDGPTGPSALSPSLIAIGDGGDEILIGIQPLTADECALHIVAAGEGDHRGAGRKRLSAWAVGIRRALEAATSRSSRVAA
jgi:nitrite reductase/ring-hydroxylating ferredoxin subunit